MTLSGFTVAKDMHMLNFDIVAQLSKKKNSDSNIHILLKVYYKQKIIFYIDFQKEEFFAIQCHVIQNAVSFFKKKKHL